MNKLLKFASATAMSALLCSVGVAAHAQSTVVLKLAHADSADMTTSRKAVMSDVFAKEVKAKSGGKIDVQVFGAGALGGERDIIEGVKNGFIQGGLASGVMANFYPPAMVTDMPYVFPTAEVADRVMDGPYGAKLSADFNAVTGMHNLCFGEVGFRQFTSGKTAIHSPKDLVGQKIRVQETPLYITEMKALGALPTPIAFPELYTALQTGVVDGEENPIPTIIFAKLYEVQKHVTLDGHNYGIDWFVVSDKFWKSLTPDLQKVVADAAKVSCAAERKANREFAAAGVATLEKNGVTVYTPTAAEMAQFKAQAQQPVVDWLKTKIDTKWVDGLIEAAK
jgi:TRAP-type transport system periplasmic protein